MYLKAYDINNDNVYYVPLSRKKNSDKQILKLVKKIAKKEGKSTDFGFCDLDLEIVEDKMSIKNKNYVTLSDLAFNAVTNYYDNQPDIDPKTKSSVMGFLAYLPEILNGAVTLGVYAGMDYEESDDERYRFNTDNYKFCNKYIKGSIKLREKYGKENFQELYSDYFDKKIKP